MPSDTEARSASSNQLPREQSPEDQTLDASAAAAGDQRKQPWRSVPEFKSAKDNVYVSKVRDMRLFGNHVNAHS